MLGPIAGKMMARWGIEASPAEADAAHIIYIALLLDALFRNPGDERRWLDETQKDLGGEAPAALLQRGGSDVLRVRQLVSLMAGHGG